MTVTSIVPTAATFEVPDAKLYYEVRGHGPLVVLIGAPMDAAAFAPLADLLAVDHTVLTTDPRGINRSPLHEPDRDSTPQQRADDLARLITHLDAGTATVLGSSGGAVTALALTQAHPELVHTLIAHEPPLDEVLEDRDDVRAASEDMVATYLAGDVIGGWKKFFAHANIFVPDPVLQQMVGGERDPRQVADELFWFAHELRPSTQWKPDIAALRAVPSRVVIGLGEESTGQYCERTSTALAALLGTVPTLFPGGHTGFADDPATFHPRLLAVLAEG